MPDANKAGQFSDDELRVQLQRYDRQPFLDVLAAWLVAQPPDAAIAEQARKNPFMWANAISALARLAGYTEKREVSVTGTIDLRQLSDSQLEAQLLEKTQRLGIPIAKVIEGSLVDTTKPDGDTP